MDSYSSPDAVSGTGALTDCVRAGSPQQILLPVLPGNVTLSGRDHGKRPARFDSTAGWVGLTDWQKGNLAADVLRDSDAAGANAGVLLNAPYDATDGPLHLLAIDVDLEPGPNAVKWRNGIVAAFGRLWQQPMLVRSTVPHRALLLVNLPEEASAGPKKRFTLSRAPEAGAKAVEIGKIELLAYGQQCVIAGVHPSGNRISWGHTAHPGEQWGAPPVKLGMPSFDSYEAVAGSVAELLEMMTDVGFSYSCLIASCEGGSPLDPDDLAAPSVSDLVDLLDRMPNPQAVDRDIYANIMLAIAGARHGLVKIRGALSTADEERIAIGVGSWAARWRAPQGHRAGTLEEEKAKWYSDWVKPRDKWYTGWRKLLGYAGALGVDAGVLSDMAMAQAQAQFTAERMPTRLISRLPTARRTITTR
jgi:hypothetical protein